MAGSTEEESSSAAAKSKQERIRDNQRKSRARRQEYLADLERRLRECDSLYREADLQKTAIVDLQTENTCLRQLLTFAGIRPDVVDTFLRHDAATNQKDPDTSSSLRQLKPKLQAPSSQPSPPSQSPSNGGRCTSAQSLATSQAQAYESNPAVSNGHLSSCEPQSYASGTTSIGQLIYASGASLQSEVNWFFEPSTAQSRPPGEVTAPFCCDSSFIPANGALLETEMLCSARSPEISSTNSISRHERWMPSDLD